MLSQFRYGIIPLLALFLGFVLVDTAAAEAARLLKGGKVLRGEIMAVDEDTLSVASQEEEIQLAISVQTRVRIFGHLEADLDDLKVDDQVMVWIMFNKDTQPLARLIVRQPEGEHVAGRLVTRLDSEFRIQTVDEHEVTVKVHPDTLLAFPWQEMRWASQAGGNDALQVGLRLIAFGSWDADGQTLNANTIVSLKARPKLRWRSGEIIRIDGNRFTLSTSQMQEIEVWITPQTHLQQPGGQSSPDDFAIGDKVFTAGWQTGPNRMTARLVFLRPPDWSHGRPFLGKIQATGGNEIRLKTAQGRTIAIMVQQETKYRIGRHGEATLADFSRGDRVLVLGSFETEARFVADYVFKRSGS